MPASGTTPEDPSDGALADIMEAIEEVSGLTVTVTALAPVDGDGNIVIVPGNGYSVAAGNEIAFTVSGLPDLSGASDIFLAIGTRDGEPGEIVRVEGDIDVDGPGDQEFHFEMTAAESYLLDDYDGVKMSFDVLATFGSDERSLVRGDVTVLKRLHPYTP